jgi:hypothetical protein
MKTVLQKLKRQHNCRGHNKGKIEGSKNLSTPYNDERTENLTVEELTKKMVLLNLNRF